MGSDGAERRFILYDIFRRNRDAALYLDFEDDRLAGFTAADFLTVQDAFLELRPETAGRIVYLFDEIQHVEGWERFCRRVTERENAAVYVTGSSSKLMPLEVDTAIRGRAWSVAVFPFSFPEFLQLRMGSLDDNEIPLRNGKGRNETAFCGICEVGRVSRNGDCRRSHGQDETVEGIPAGDVLSGSRRAVWHDEHRPVRRPRRQAIFLFFDAPVPDGLLPAVQGSFPVLEGSPFPVLP